ncbi:hypothetical protein HDZ31DRAFT_83668 [Schizophyllum fasciatum]
MYAPGARLPTLFSLPHKQRDTLHGEHDALHDEHPDVEHAITGLVALGERVYTSHARDLPPTATMAKKRRSLQSLFIPGDASHYRTPSKESVASFASAGTDSLTPTPSHSPPPADLLDDDPFANLALPRVSPSAPPSTPVMAAPTPRSPLRATHNFSTDTIIPTLRSPAESPTPPPVPPKDDLPQTRPSTPRALSSEPRPVLARPASQRPAFKTRPSLPSLRVLANMALSSPRCSSPTHQIRNEPETPQIQAPPSTPSLSSVFELQEPISLAPHNPSSSSTPDFTSALDYTYPDYTSAPDYSSNDSRSNTDSDTEDTTSSEEEELQIGESYAAAANEPALSRRLSRHSLSRMPSLARSSSSSSDSSSGLPTDASIDFGYDGYMAEAETSPAPADLPAYPWGGADRDSFSAPDSASFLERARGALPGADEDEDPEYASFLAAARGSILLSTRSSYLSLPATPHASFCSSTSQDTLRPMSQVRLALARLAGGDGPNNSTSDPEPAAPMSSSAYAAAFASGSGSGSGAGRWRAGASGPPGAGGGAGGDPPRRPTNMFSSASETESETSGASSSGEDDRTIRRKRRRERALQKQRQREQEPAPALPGAPVQPPSASSASAGPLSASAGPAPAHRSHPSRGQTHPHIQQAGFLHGPPPERARTAQATVERSRSHAERGRGAAAVERGAAAVERGHATARSKSQARGGEAPVQRSRSQVRGGDAPVQRSKSQVRGASPVPVPDVPIPRVSVERGKSVRAADVERGRSVRRAATTLPPVPPVPAALAGVTEQTRIFVGDRQRFHTVEVGPATRASDVIDVVAAEGVLDQWVGTGGWMLFEVAQDFGMERPIRSFEHVADVQAGWNKDKTVNILVLKLTPLEIKMRPASLPQASPIHGGYVEWESRRGKWTKRYLRLKEHGLWLSKRDNGKDAVLLCQLSNFDVYTVTRLYKAPKPFVFAIKSTDNLSYFEDTADYLHVFACQPYDGENWVEKIMLARVLLRPLPGAQHPVLREACAGAARAQEHHLAPHTAAGQRRARQRL